MYVYTTQQFSHLINAMSEDTGKEPDKPTVPSSEHEEVTGELAHSVAAYGPDGVRGIFSSGYVFGAALLASLGGFSFGYDQGVISIINEMTQFHRAFPQTETAFGTSFMTAMLLLGAFVGCLFMPYLADRISRKWALTVVVIIFDIGAIIQTAAQDYGMLVAGRAIGGIGVGTLAMVYTHIILTTSLLTLPRQHHFISRKSPPQTFEARCWSWNPSRLSPASLSRIGSPSQRASWRAKSLSDFLSACRWSAQRSWASAYTSSRTPHDGLHSWAVRRTA